MWSSTVLAMTWKLWHLFFLDSSLLCHVFSAFGSLFVVVWQLPCFYSVQYINHGRTFRAHCRCYGWDDCSSDFLGWVEFISRDSLGPEVQPEKWFLDVSRTCWHRFSGKSHWNYLIITLLWLVHIAILVKFWDVHLFLGPGLLLIPAVAEHWGVPVACVMCDVWCVMIGVTVTDLWCTLISFDDWVSMHCKHMLLSSSLLFLQVCALTLFCLFPFFIHVYLFVSISHVSIWICIIS